MAGGEGAGEGRGMAGPPFRPGRNSHGTLVAQGQCFGAASRMTPVALAAGRRRGCHPEGWRYICTSGGEPTREYGGWGTRRQAILSSATRRGKQRGAETVCARM